MSKNPATKLLPLSIKVAAVALALSCISTLVAVYFDGLEYEELSFSDPLTFGMNAVWSLIIVWIIWDLLKGKGIKKTLLYVGFVILVFLAWDFVEFGFGVAQIFYGIELLMFIVAYFAVNSKGSEEWYESKKS